MQVYRNKGHAWIYPEDPNPKISIINNFSELDTYVSESLLSESELRRLHRRFGHPSASKLINLLQRAGYADNLDNTTIEKLTRYCTMCQKHGKSPGRFKFTIQGDTKQFNY